jgi:two-component system NtrC family sensor kinase
MDTQFVKFIRNMKIGKKLILTGIGFILPSLILLYMLVEEKNIVIKFSQNELGGTTYLKPIENLLKDIQQHKLIEHRFLSGDKTIKSDKLNKLSQIENDFKTLGKIDNKLNEQLKTTIIFNSLKSNFRELKNSSELSKSKSTEINNRMINEINSFITHLGNSSNLILDPDLDSFYIMESVVVNLPETQIILSNLLEFSEDIIKRKAISNNEKTQLIVWTGLIKSNLKKIESGMKSSFENNPAKNVKPALNDTLITFISKANSLIKILETDLINSKEINTNLNQFVKLNSNVIDLSFNLWDRTVAELETLLESRIHKFKLNEFYNIFTVVSLLFFFCFISIVIILDVTNSIILLTHSSKEFAAGNLEKRVQINSKDEIGELANSFNNMANQIQSSILSLISSEEKFKKLFNISPLSTFILDAETNQVVLANKASEKNFEYNITEMIGKTTSELNIISQEEQNRLIENIDQLGKIEAIESFLTSKTGKRIDSLAYFIPIIINGKHFNIGMSLDITELKKTEGDLKKINNELDTRVKQRTIELEQINQELIQTIDELKTAQYKLIQSEKMASLGVLTAGIAHEINNPINYINLSILGLKNIIGEILYLIEKYEQITFDNYLNKLKEIEEYKEQIDFNDLKEGLNLLTANIEMGVNRTSEIVKGLKTFSRSDDETKYPCDINANLELTITLLHNQFNGFINIKREYDKLPNIMCYPGKINQVFLNLISNSIDSIKSKSELDEFEEILIRTTVKGDDYIIIEIKDTGKGIPKNIQKRIFEPFFTTKEVGKGTGLGLSITSGIIKSHNGRIEVRSDPGKGASFIILLPFRNEIDS